MIGVEFQSYMTGQGLGPVYGGVRFEGTVYQAGHTGPVERFEPFRLLVADGYALEQLQDEMESVYAFSFVGSASRAAHRHLRPLQAKRVFNGGPRATMAGFYDAVCFEQGELVTFRLTLYDREKEVDELVKTGIITNLRWTGGPGGARSQRLDFVFHRCDRLHVINNVGSATTLTSVEAYESDPS